MRALLTAVVGVGLVVCATATGQDDKKEMEKLQGTWSIVSAEKGGKPAPKDVQSMKLIFKGDMLTVQMSADEKKEATFKLDASKKPKEITLKTEDEAKTLEGIYEFDGDQLKLTFADEGGGARPKEFGSKEGSRNMAMVLKREKKK